MIQYTYQSLEYYRFCQWTSLNHGIFTRKGGVSAVPWDGLNVGGTVGDAREAVVHNHQLMYDALAVNRDRVCTSWLVHGADTVVVMGPVRGRRWVALADAMVTDQPDTPLMMRYADCTPIILYDPKQCVIGIAHAGWRGTVLGVASSAVQTMIQAYGCKPANIQAGVGPAIGPDCYQVGEEVIQAVQERFGTVAGDAFEGPLMKRDPSDGTAYLNLWSANRIDLERAGVEQIEIARICTATRTDLFYSHRAEKGHTGRFGVVVSL